MSKSLLNDLGYTPTLTTDESPGNRAFWAAKDYLSDETRESVLTADIVLVPEGSSFRGVGFYFPEGTIEFLEFFKSKDLTVEIAADDESFNEVARHSALVYLGELILTTVILPTASALLAQYLGERFLNPKENPIRLGITVERPDGSTGHISYEGLASDFETRVMPVLAQVGLGPTSDATPQLPPDANDD